MSLKTTIEKIRTLEAEKKNLLVEIEGLKKIADSKAVALENEVNALREEIKSLRILVSGSESSTQNKTRGLIFLKFFGRRRRSLKQRIDCVREGVASCLPRLH